MMREIMKFFGYKHLPPHLKEVSKKFSDLAEYIEAELPHNSESKEALRKLLEAKDCAVRSKV